jgi:hypothetical protein
MCVRDRGHVARVGAAVRRRHRHRPIPPPPAMPFSLWILGGLIGTAQHHTPDSPRRCSLLAALPLPHRARTAAGRSGGIEKGNSRESD